MLIEPLNSRDYVRTKWWTNWYESMEFVNILSTTLKLFDWHHCKIKINQPRPKAKGVGVEVEWGLAKLRLLTFWFEVFLFYLFICATLLQRRFLIKLLRTVEGPKWCPMKLPGPEQNLTGQPYNLSKKKLKVFLTFIPFLSLTSHYSPKFFVTAFNTTHWIHSFLLISLREWSYWCKIMICWLLNAVIFQMLNGIMKLVIHFSKPMLKHVCLKLGVTNLFTAVILTWNCKTNTGVSNNTN